MKNNIKWYILIEAVLAVLLIGVVFVMLREKGGRDMDRISVIVPNSDDSQWTSFRYGLEMAAQDMGAELVFVSTEGILTAQEEEQMIQQEIASGADAVIVQPVWESGAGEMLERMGKKVPLMLTERLEEETDLPVTEPDHYGIGKALGEELLRDYGGRLEGKTVGILMESEGSRALRVRGEGFWEALEGSGLEARWVLSGSPEGELSLEEQDPVDFVIALDDRSMKAAGEASGAGWLHGALVYGIGNSTEAAYCLDQDSAKCLVVPDGFQAGYQSLAEVSRGLKDYLRRMEDHQVSYSVIRRDTLFSEENQEILFTMSQ